MRWIGVGSKKAMEKVMQKLKQLDSKWTLVLTIGTIVALSAIFGMAIALLTGSADNRNARQTSLSSVEGSQTSSLPQASPIPTPPDSLVFPVALQAAEARQPILSQIVAGTHPNQANAAPLDQSRAKYLLATDALRLGNPQEAIAHLDTLADSYPGMEKAILHRQAQAYAASGDPATAQQKWQQLLTSDPNHPLAAEALFALGQTDPQYWDQAIEQFPSHPRTIEIANIRLQDNTNQPQLLKLLAHHALYHPDIVDILDRLTTNYSNELTPEDWEAIGFGYWEKWQYGKAGNAYGKAPVTPQNSYRAGRGAHLGGRRQDAIAHYQSTVQRFPSEKDTAQALLHLAKLVSPQVALSYLDDLKKTFPDRGDEMLLARAKVLEKLNSSVSAQQARQSILSQYSDSDTAAEMRWEKAQNAADAQNWQEAWKWAGEVVQHNPDSDLAPEAAFWVGKWAQQLGKTKEANQAFDYVLKTYSDSYYAWRAAVQLGWDVGDFQTVRQKSPALVSPPARSPLPQGSEMLQEFYLLGQDEEAWRLWQTEFQNQKAPTVAEQFTDGVLHVGVGHYLYGIFLLDNLDWRPAEGGPLVAETALQYPTHAYTLYPIPYQDTIRAWSHQRELNPILVTSLMRQESRFQPSIQSIVGATGLMQIMPATGQWIADQLSIDGYDLTDPQDSIKLGTWYLGYTHDEYANNSMLAVASYNAGPGNVAKWVDKFGTQDLDRFVAQIPFPETQGYVTSVFENYWNYLQLYNTEIANQLNR